MQLPVYLPPPPDPGLWSRFQYAFEKVESLVKSEVVLCLSDALFFVLLADSYSLFKTHLKCHLIDLTNID